MQYFTPSYSLYPVLAAIHGACAHAVPLHQDFGLPAFTELKWARQWDFQAALTFITTPNAPSGRGYSRPELEALCRAQAGVVVLDEAYVDFAPEHALDLALRYPHVLVARTFSKGYSLCFLRVGYVVGSAELIAALHKIRDSYNVNGLGQIAAAATLDDLPYYRKNFQRVMATRERVSAALGALGFQVFPSQTNFILAEITDPPAQQVYEKLIERNVYIRYFNKQGLNDKLRITVGAGPQNDALLAALREIILKE